MILYQMYSLYHMKKHMIFFDMENEDIFPIFELTNETQFSDYLKKEGI